MNIKNVISFPVQPIDPKPRVDGNARAQNAGDRDANGRQETPEQETRRHLNDKDFEEALKLLAETPGLKANNLSIRVETKEDCRVVLIVDSTGQVVRRLSEAQLWTATRDKDRQTGKFLDKAM